MTSKECEEQLQRLIYDWETEGLLTKLNATDIEAIKHLMLENQTQQDFIKTQNKLVHSLETNINEAIEYMNNYIELEDAPINERIKIEFKDVVNKLNKKN
jgi:hypothetical protein